jgi:plastocyanin
VKSVRIAAVCFLCTFGLALKPMVAPIHAQSAAVVVTIQDYFFSPATTTVTAGTTVVWTNKGPSDHSSTSDTGVWDAGIVAVGTSSSGTAFNTPGTYPYHCAIHPEMMGMIIVTGSSSGPTPTPTLPVAPTATATAVATLGSTAAATATATPLPTATNTKRPLFVKLAIGHKTVKAGAKQSIKVTTLAGAAISIGITFPDGAKKHRAAIAPKTGIFAWTFKQPGGHTTRTKHAAKVAVTVSQGAGSPIKSTKSYTIR